MSGFLSSRLGPRCTDEGAQELALHAWSNRIDIDSLRGEELLRLAQVVDTRRLDADVDEASRFELRSVVGLLESPGDAPDPQLHAASDLTWNLASNDHVGDREAATRPKDS